MSRVSYTSAEAAASSAPPSLSVCTCRVGADRQVLCGRCLLRDLRERLEELDPSLAEVEKMRGPEIQAVEDVGGINDRRAQIPRLMQQQPGAQPVEEERKTSNAHKKRKTPPLLLEIRTLA